MGEGIAAKWLELIKASTPKAARVGVLRDPRNVAHASMLGEIDRAGRGIGIVARALDAASPNEIDGAIAAAHREIDAVIFLPQPAASADPRIVIRLAAKYRLPAVYLNRSFAEAGGLMSYGPRIADLWRGAAEFVDRILKGARPADLPVDQPTRFELVINRKTARTLGLTIPPALLLRADHVID
jgi:putative ABC transport system substrate-binding protein